MFRLTAYRHSYVFEIAAAFWIILPRKTYIMCRVSHQIFNLMTLCEVYVKIGLKYCDWKTWYLLKTYYLRKRDFFYCFIKKQCFLRSHKSCFHNCIFHKYKTFFKTSLILQKRMFSFSGKNISCIKKMVYDLQQSHFGSLKQILSKFTHSMIAYVFNKWVSPQIETRNAILNRRSPTHVFYEISVLQSFVNFPKNI